MEQALEVRPVTRRQQGWLNAHERRENDVGDLFGWWMTISYATDDTLSGALRSFNAQQVRPLPLSGDEWNGP